jgi:serine-type D-Ala-D-Ala carboxypeptidase (penicillin-binding protein 5/6)
LRKAVIPVAAAFVVVVAVAIQLLRPVAAVAGTALPPSPPRAASVQLPCPSAGGAAIAVGGIGTVATCGTPAPGPMYSTAKIMTALVVLSDHPLARGAGGPELTISQADVDRTAQESAADASVVPVAAGEQLSELQALEGLLIPSGNNLAEVLAAWDAGSVAGFVAKMNAKAAQLGLTSTHFDDTSGFSEKTVSVPLDLLKLARAAVTDPVFADIVNMPTASLPVAGTVYNINTQLGKHGIAGIKTGSAPHGTASFAGLTLEQVAGQPVAIYTAVMGVPDLPAAFGATEKLADAVASALVPWRLAERADLAEYRAPWGARADAGPTSALTVLLWPGGEPHLSYSLVKLPPGARAGSDAGVLSITYGEQAYQLRLVTTTALSEPGRRYRLTRLT